MVEKNKSDRRRFLRAAAAGIVGSAAVKNALAQKPSREQLR